MHPHMLRHTYVTMLDAGVNLRDVQIAARHADPRTTMRPLALRCRRPAACEGAVCFARQDVLYAGNNQTPACGCVWRGAK